MKYLEIDASASNSSLQTIEMETIAGSESVGDSTVDEEKPKYTTNRTKAIIAMNLYALFSVVFV